jgi:hypothetical protein
MISPNALLIEQAKIVVGLGPVAPSTSTPDYVTMKGASRCTILIPVQNGVTPTGSAISITQAVDVSNTSGKALAFTTAYRALNTGAGGNTDVLTSFTVSSNTFTTDATAANTLLYAIEVNETDLDINNGFDCIRVNTGNSVNAVLSVLYVLWPQKFAKTLLPSAVAD